MASYEGFASMYDALMVGTPYENWAEYIDEVLFEHFCGKPRNNFTVLDLACGTGNITLRLAEMGYDLIGADASEDMLAEANRKAYEANKNILFIRQDMRELNLFGTIDATVCVCDGLNYILSESDLLTVFKRVHLFLNPNGIFIFDMNTEYKFKEMFSNNIFEDVGEGGESYEWENAYDPQTKINEYRITFFLRNEDNAFEEIHKQRAYPTSNISNLLREAGFSSVEIRNGYTHDPPTAQSDKVVYIARM
ncbi:MAG: class I SAM-dependent methyltransferase [Defluviitaleaceae bacterium]|nr:class I SAM-dependent methyltransferase [Defluviitaleaceae bacterium]MCL2263566.1 class I SAM-dependent methyltransferase [Defluviitaleaceae bacterium]